MRERPRLFTFLNVACLPFAWSTASAGTVLPVPCAASACNNSKFGATGFVSAGTATATQSGSKLTVNQTSSNVTLNWQSFNISANGTVQFVQPSASAVALNQINDVNPSQIFGALNANGRVFLINQNGIVFGSGAQVNVGGLLASTLDIANAAVSGGLIAPGSNGNPAFQAFSTGTTGGVTISQRASLQTASGGQILIFAPSITNEGSISTPGGQTMLAAGDTIYLATQSDPSLRGLLVQVGGTGGTVTNGAASNSAVKSPEQLVGQILATDGNVTLAGLAVNQLGRVSATTSINENGSIYLQAVDHGTIGPSGAAGVSGTLSQTNGTPQDGTGGQLTLGANSETEVTLDASSATTVNSVKQLPSRIAMTGDRVQILSDSVTRATGGQLSITAAQSPGVYTASPDGSRVYVASGADLDVSGASIVLPVTDNVIPVQLRGYELADSPLQQNGPLRSQTVYVDIRTGTPLANISGEVAAIGYNVVERNLNGGTIAINSAGDAILAPGSTVDVAGGQIQYTGGYLKTSDLLTTAGQVVPIGSANPNVSYVGIVNSATLSNPKWGTSTTYESLQPTWSPGYIEGKNGGNLSISARQFVLDSTVDAGVQSGLYQRNPDTALAALNAPYDINTYQPYNQVPLPASLVIGTPGEANADFVVGNVTLSPEIVPPTLLNANGTPFNPLSDPLPAAYTASVLRPELLGTDGFGSVTIYANGKVLLPASVAVELPAGGKFSVTASSIDIEGQISAPGGNITALAEPTGGAALTEPFALILGPKASLSADGEWVNDNPLLYPNANSAPLFINGGNVSLAAISNNSANPGVELAPGSRIDVSGGGQLTAAGVLNAGVGGTISIAAGLQGDPLQGGTPSIAMGATLTGYGIYEGGTLDLTASAVCIAAADCRGGNSATLWMRPAQLASGGFSDYALTADQGGIWLADDTTVTLRQSNLVLPAGYAGLRNMTSLIGTASIATLADQLRQPVSLSLSQVGETSTASVNGVNYFNVTSATPSLTIGAGSQILADPLASLSLSSEVRIIDDGTLSAPGGTIALSLLTSQPEATYNNTQAIWLGPQAVLNAAGVPRIFPNGLGQQTGEILPGGTVILTASRGFLELLPGSLIDVAGSAGVIAETPAGGGALRSEQVASAGGVIDLTASDGAELGGQLEAAAGKAGPGLPQPAGGTFSLTLDTSGRNDLGATAPGLYGGSTSFPGYAGITSSQIIVSGTQPPIVIDPGLGIPNALAENAYVSASALAAAGFDIVNLRATPLSIFSDYAPLPGRIEFIGNVTLSAAESITLDAGVYSVSPGSTARVTAPYVEFGDSNVTFLNNVTAANAISAPGAPAGGTLDVSGHFIELYGTSALQGINTASFSASGDLRLRGLLTSTSDTATTFDGALYTDGNLNLTAQQIYPTTLSQFVISADPGSVTAPTANVITVHTSAGTADTPLSAGGALTLSAGTVIQDGVLRAPFGDITLDAASVVLGAGSLTSTSASGLIIPFGTTQGGIDWVYPLPNGNSVIYGTDGIAPPSQQVTLRGAKVNVNEGATIDVAGGGDLRAYEWIDGTGGTNDVLSNSSTNGGRPGQFAILPSLGGGVSPYDPNISNGTTLQVGDSVYLSGMQGLAAGVYTLLPARYALLPGAFLVTQASGYQDIRSGQVIPVLGGGDIISGYQTVAGTPFGGSYGESRTGGFEVVPASIVLQQAQYTITSANEFFANQAQNAHVSSPRLPLDSGVLALVASDALTLGGTLDTTAPKGGLGAEVDISSANILVAPTAIAGQAGQIVLTAGSLDSLGAQTLLLGGLNNAGSITTTAQTVDIGSGAALTAPDVIVTALNQVTVEGGASVTAAGSAPGSQSFSLTGDGAFLNVSAGLQSTVTRANPAGQVGILDLAAGSTLAAAGGSVYLEASDNVATAGHLSLAGGDLAVQSSSILLGNAVRNTTGTLLSGALLGSESLRSLLLVSAAPIEMNGSVTANASNITVDAPGFVDVGANDVATLNAGKSITLQNSQGTSVAAGGTGTGTLRLDAANIILNGGSMTASGFDLVAVRAADALTATASSALGTGGGLSLSASQITTAADVSLSLTANGAVSLLAPAKRTALAAAALGGSLSVTGSSIDVSTEIELPSGRVDLTSTSGDLTIASGGSINVAGIVQQYDGVSVASPGGSVLLASTGNITLASGSSVDVSAAKGGAAGSLSLSAPGTGGAGGSVVVTGNLAGSGTAGEGGSFSIDARAFDFDALNSLLNAGGFTGARTVRLRGPGNLEVLAAGSNDANAVTGSQVELEADRGSVLVNAGALIDASGAHGGQVVLAAANSVIVNGIIDAHATLAGQGGGTVTLESGDAAAGSGSSQILVNAGSTINVSGAGPSADGAAGAGGSVLLSAPLATVQSWLDGTGGIALAGRIAGASRTALVANHVYQNTSGVIESQDMSTYQSDATAFMTAASTGPAAAITAAAASACNCGFELEPGVEIDAAVSAANPTGALTLNTPWNLYTWRFGADNVPGVLTLRAQGGITFDASLSDGFAATSGTGAFTLPTTASDSWSYRIVAGADFTAADPQAVLAPNAANPGTVTICDALCAASIGATSAVTSRDYAPTMVRTGDGFIDVSASGDLVLGSQAALLYTAGVAEPGVMFSTGGLGRGSAPPLAYPIGGGDIQVSVAGDVLGAPTDQFVNAWQWRLGSAVNDGIAPALATSWTTNFQDFQQGIGALAGGNVAIRAGGDIDNLSVSIATVGVPVGGAIAGVSAPEVFGGGNLIVAAGGSILGGSYDVGRGQLSLIAGADVGPTPATLNGGTAGAAPIIGLGDASLAVTARGNVQVAEIFNPTLLAQGIFQPVTPAPVYFSTYGADSSANLTAVGGSVTLDDESIAVGNAISSSFLSANGVQPFPPGGGGVLDTLPSSVNLVALSGNVNISRSLVTSPSSSGNLQAFANQNITVGSADVLIVPDADPRGLPSAGSPVNQNGLGIYSDIEGALSLTLPDQHAAVPIYAAADAAGTLQPVRIVALNGSIDFPLSTGTPDGIWAAKPVQIVAGGDISGLNLVAQNLSSSDVTSILAGGNVTYPQQRVASGQVLADASGIAIDGPGELELTAGGNVNLGTSNGIITRANLVNPVLPSTGASISVQAGIGAASPAQYAAFINTYIDNSNQFDSNLIAYIESIDHLGGLTAAQAKRIFNAISPELQRVYVEDLFFDLLQYYGSKEAASGNGDFSGAFAAISKLFPGANPAAGSTNPYQGNINLYFSQIYTEQGGNISLLAPGGGIDAGLALAPASFGIDKQPDQLGIVAATTGNVSTFTYGDLQIDQSRLFAANGGDIIVWSTDGNIDAGAGAKTSISAPEVNIAYDSNGQPTTSLRAAIAGSGIEALAATPGVSPGNVYLFAPRGVVNAGDAGIVAGNLTVAATAVIGANNITVSGTSVGVPLAPPALGANFAGASSTAGSAAAAAESFNASSGNAGSTPVADAAIGWLDVFVTGLGEADCKPDDLECLKHEGTKARPQ